ncbi:MAG: hypothetical protein R3B95_11615 [Nitrospirales bacterium]|nr:hypothetical protein [Nitrospirales bacterium]
MTPAELQSLRWFKYDVYDYAGRVIDWATYSYRTMWWVNVLRERVGSPCILIRGSHGEGKETAVDFFFPHAPYGLVMMETLRLPDVSFGFYSGRNLHLDTRAYSEVPARWLAIRQEQEPLLKQAGLGHLMVNRANEWTYLTWTDRTGPAALNFIANLAA